MHTTAVHHAYWSIVGCEDDVIQDPDGKWGQDRRWTSKQKASPFFTTAIQLLHDSSQCTIPPVNVTFQSPLSHKQDPKMFKLLCLRVELSPSLKRTGHPLLIENSGLRLGGDSHPSCFTLGCKLPRYSLLNWNLIQWRFIEYLPC